LPRAVLYGFIENHEQRNVASANWLENLARFSHRGHVSVPYATLEENRLTRQASEHYPAWPLRERFAVVASVEFAYARFIAKARTRQSVPVTRALLVEMHRLTRSRGIPFVVALLNFRADTRRRYMDFFRDQGIPYADCDFPLTRNEVVAGEWVHPTGRVHSYYADCIVATVKEILE
ncbi:MAG: hypothetical protein OEQ39_10510, partial [Gammaproteobacteria bacterium]|nr:hypothetical protein [Gammaproteobacteria bacterium]